MAVSEAREVAPATVRLWLTDLVGSDLVDAAGQRQGEVIDAVVRLGNGGYPPVTGLLARVGGRKLFVPRGRLGDVAAGQVVLTAGLDALTHFERRPGEVLLRQDVLDRRMISVETGRVINANDIELALLRGAWRVNGVDAGTRNVLRNLVPRGMRRHSHEKSAFVDWTSVEPFTRHVPTSRLLMPVRRLRRLHPAQIADIVEQVSHDEGEEIIDAVHADPELEADVFEELNTEHQVEFLRQRSDDEAAGVLAGMAPDDAADLITELDQDRRMDVLTRLPAAQQAKVRALLSYNPESAGGLMAPDFVAVLDTATVGEALEAVRKSSASAQQSADVYVTDADGRLVGAMDLVNLVRARADTRVKQLVERGDTALEVGDDLPEVARMMTDFNLTVAPVVDQDRRLIGVISVDDVLEAMLPDSWRRRSEADTD
ncbi:MAG: magnesium transporter [Candidatus Dormibacteraeota bacterium]|nr:magnesium transporter [Candidatus Dormibacteraeota bacterium]MBV9524452.1 magnesium transporter [Candidatus Dormibacteraeota bacterium]